MQWKWRALGAVSLEELIRALNIRMTQLASLVSATAAGVSGGNTFKDGDTTPSVAGAKIWQASNTGATNITKFDGGTAQSEIIVWATTGNTTFVHSATLRMLGGANVTMAATGVRRFATVDGANWREI